jgi:DNA primase
VLLQIPDVVRNDPFAASVYAELVPQAYGVPHYRDIFEAIGLAGGVSAADGSWVENVLAHAPGDVAAAINGLAVTPLPHDKPETIGAYAGSVLAKVLDAYLTKSIGELRGAMQRAGEQSADYWQIFGELNALESRKRALKFD